MLIFTKLRPSALFNMRLLDFVQEIGKLKDIERTGWKIYSVHHPESVSDHCFRTAMLALLYAKEAKLDVNKCVRMALIHDIHEVYTGDIATRPKESMQKFSNSRKREIENNAMKKLLQKLPQKERRELYSLWSELEGQKTAESRFVNDMDKIEMVLQALEYKKYKRTSKNLDEFFLTSESRIKTKKGKELFRKIKGEYVKLK